MTSIQHSQFHIPLSQRIVLASASPRRRSLLAEYGITAEAIAPPLEEPTAFPENLTPAQRAEAASFYKAVSVAAMLARQRHTDARRAQERSITPAAGCHAQVQRGHVSPPKDSGINSLSSNSNVTADTLGDLIIIAGDTIVSLNGRVFGKPADRSHAREILNALRGTTHEVITGVTLLYVPTGRRLIKHEVTRVTMRRVSDEVLDRYLDSNAWAGKAGAYGIQDADDPFVERIEGSFTNVVGMPMELLHTMWSAIGISKQHSIAAR